MRLKLLNRENAGVGAVLTGFQIGIALLMAPGDTLEKSYLDFCKWDCAWYESITQDGYHSVIPPVAQKAELSNVAFFPAYPYLGRGLTWVFGIQPQVSLLLVAQIACFVFWTALWGTLRHWKISWDGALLICLAVLAHPAAFYLVMGYSESLFLASLLIFIFTESESKLGIFKASLSGAIMSSTRIVGLPVAGFPMLRQISLSLMSRSGFSKQKLIPSVITSLIASSGAVLFFIYCKVRFGHFDLYMQTQQIGWGIVPDYGAIWKWKSFVYASPLDQIATLGSALVFAFFLGLEITLVLGFKNTGLRRRAPIYGVAFLIFYISLGGLKSRNFSSMIRYSLPWYILLLLCLAHLCLRVTRVPVPWVRFGFLLMALGCGFIFFKYEVPHLRDFLHGRWFA